MAEPRRLLVGQRQEHQLLADAFRAVARPGRPLEVLEAGCGQKWPIALPELQLRITGVDYDPEALRIRQEVRGDLDVMIHGDLRTVDLPAGAFDVAYCAFVLEHVHGAERVLDRLALAIRPGGRLIVRIPDGRSVFGFASKHLPLWFAVLYKKHVEHFKEAGKPGHAPYPTVYEDVVTVEGMREYASRRSLLVVEEYGIDYVLQNFGRLRPVASFGLKAAAAASGRRLSATHNNLGFVLERPAAA